MTQPDVLDAGRLFRLPWTAADNAMTWLEPTRKCNITCDACFATNDPRSEKPLTQVEHELDAMLRLRRCDAVLIAGGEPLTYPGLADVVALVKSRGRKPVLITNGVGLDRARLHDLKAAGLHGVTFHVDSHQRRPGWLGRDEAELNALREELAGLVRDEGGLTCSFNTTIFPDTLEAVPSIVEWAARHPDTVQVLTLICVRMAERDGPYTYQVAGREVDFSKTPYLTDRHDRNLTTEEIYARVRAVLPDFELSGYLGGTVHPHALKWAVGSHLCTAERSFGSLGARTMELAQNVSHAARGRYLAYTDPAQNRRGRLAFLLAPFDATLRRALVRYVAAIVRNPATLFGRLFVQSLSIVQPVDVLPNGEMDTRDGCPNRTFWQERLVPACRLEEYQLFGGPVSMVPRGGGTA